MNKLFILVGPSAAGKTLISNFLVHKDVNFLQNLINVVNDLELKDYKNNEREGKYVRFTLAVNEYNVKRNEKIATFVEIVAFDKKAIILAHNVGKGSRLAVEGRISTSNYITESGEKRYKVDVILNEFTFIDSKKKVVNEVINQEVAF